MIDMTFAAVRYRLIVMCIYNIANRRCRVHSLYAKYFYQPGAQAVEPIFTRHTPADARSRKVVPFGG